MHVLPEAWTVYNGMYGCSRGLFFMDGPEWLHHRRIMNKLLLKSEFKWIEEACEVAAHGILRRIRRNSNAEFPDLERELYKWSIEVLVSILLGAETFQKESKQLNGYIERLASTVCLVFHTSADLSLIPAKFAAKYRIPRWKRFVAAVDSALLAANDLVAHLNTGDGLLAKMRHEGVGELEIVRIVVDLVLAAGDTTAYSMEWMLYLLAKNVDVQQRLRDGENGLLRGVMRESLRLYPVAPFLTRILPEEATIADYRVPGGSLIVMSVFSSGRNGAIYAEPEAFRPERWLRGNQSGKEQIGSLPFAIGARSCIGRRIAEVQLQRTLAMLVGEFDIELLNGDEVDVVLKMVAVPSERIRLKFNRL